MPRPRLALVAVLVLTATVARAAGPLKWSPKPGETLKYTLGQVFDVKKAQPGQEVSGKTELTVDLTWKVVAVAPDGTFVVEQTIDRVRTKNSAPGVVLLYDSKDGKAAEATPMRDVARSYEAVLGKPYKLKISPQGEVVDATMPEGSTEALIGSRFAEMADAGTFFSEAGVKNLLGQALPKLPKGPEVTWDADLTLPAGPLMLGYKTRYRLKPGSSPATIEADVATAMTPAPGARITARINKQSGTALFVFDPAAGRLDSATVRQSADVTINDGTAEFTQATETTLTFRLVK